MLESLQDTLSHIWTDMLARTSGPLSFRFILQPVMAAILAIRDGARDARGHHRPYLWMILTHHGDRAARIVKGLTATARIIILGLAMDTIYQFIVFKAFYPVEALNIALLLAFIPYLLLRGPADRIARWWYEHRPSDQTPNP